ncbi:MAG: hypothetical protein ACREDO_04500 [Methyloceanibacter sp.]
MVQLITPRFRRRRFFKVKRRGRVWNFVRRYQLVELFGLTGAIALVWLGAHLDNRANFPDGLPTQMDLARIRGAGVVRGG